MNSLPTLENVFETGITLPGRSEAGPSSGHAVTTAANVQCLGTGKERYFVTAVNLSSLET